MRMPTRSQFNSFIGTLLVCLAAALILSSCKKSPQQKILGTWNVDGKQTTVEYRKDGTFVTTENGKSTTGKYHFTDDSHLELQVTSVLQGTNTIDLRLNCEVAFHGDKADLTTTMAAKEGMPAMSQTLHYTRAN